MPANEKEFNGNLFDQLVMIERIERRLHEGGEEAAQKEIDLIKSEINRKLYQQPPLTNE
ncbi:MAG: hypothetical protein K2M91_03235 [Lachnospiraceae bacterium]|nr:hypothetical protein [Lachnospiraceae bacterium]